MHQTDATASALEETITLQQAKKLIQCMAHEQSFLLLAPPGVGKSDMVVQAAQEVGLPCRSLLGTQIAPEDVSGIPRIIGERSVFCPPRVLLPEKPEAFCLFLDELPACAPDVQKAFYSLLLERNGRTVVYSTDAEHKPEDEADLARFAELFRDADLVIFDAMYSLAESVSVREDWGHSNNVVGVELCRRANAKRLALFHHEPVNDDGAVEQLWHDAQRLEEITRKGSCLQVLAAYDGLELVV